VSRKVIADTSALVALLNVRDAHHAWAVERFRELAPPIVSCEAVLAEAQHLLRAMPRSLLALRGLWERNILRAEFEAQDQKTALLRLLQRYANVPMSFADACLVRLSEMNMDSVIWTLDSDFGIYRRNGRQVIPLIGLED
jgi:predicted nucleic acid-binding protein